MVQETQVEASFPSEPEEIGNSLVTLGIQHASTDVNHVKEPVLSSEKTGDISSVSPSFSSSFCLFQVFYFFVNFQVILAYAVAQIFVSGTSRLITIFDNAEVPVSPGPLVS